MNIEFKILNIDVFKIKSILKAKKIDCKYKFIEEIFILEVPKINNLYKINADDSLEKKNIIKFLNSNIDLNEILDSKIPNYIALCQSLNKVILKGKTQINVANINEAKQILEDLGIQTKGHSMRMYISYECKNTQFVIIKRPRLNPYLEINSATLEEAYKFVNMLGFKKEDAKVFERVKDIYTEYGINIDLKEFNDLSFNEDEKKQVQKYMDDFKNI